MVHADIDGERFTKTRSSPTSFSWFRRTRDHDEPAFNGCGGLRHVSAPGNRSPKTRVWSAPQSKKYCGSTGRSAASRAGPGKDLNCAAKQIKKFRPAAFGSARRQPRSEVFRAAEQFDPAAGQQNTSGSAREYIPAWGRRWPGWRLRRAYAYLSEEFSGIEVADLRICRYNKTLSSRSLQSLDVRFRQR